MPYPGTAVKPFDDQAFNFRFCFQDGITCGIGQYTGNSGVLADGSSHSIIPGNRGFFGNDGFAGLFLQNPDMTDKAEYFLAYRLFESISQ